MTRPELEQLATILQHMRAGREAYGEAIKAMLDLCVHVELEHEVEDKVNASLEQLSKGTGHDDRSV